MATKTHVPGPALCGSLHGVPNLALSHHGRAVSGRLLLRVIARLRTALCLVLRRIPLTPRRTGLPISVVIPALPRAAPAPELLLCAQLSPQGELS